MNRRCTKLLPRVMLMMPQGGQPFCRFWLRQHPWPIISCFRLASKKFTQPPLFDELFNFVLEQSVFLSIMAVVAMVGALFASIAYVWGGRSPSGLGGWLLTSLRIRVRGAGHSCETFREGFFAPFCRGLLGGELEKFGVVKSAGELYAPLSGLPR
ncbi:hypothetical protein COCNU_01G008240 [Cocos nucifera]|uniref:Uncharacterized protein n=1 Tax=Cocos nucifera TaxID=13894 RepID=A0A8K0MUY3_COCNU|nr:hypothetical protein COCNU_01G008240 [Cocos nucifera]